MIETPHNIVNSSSKRNKETKGAWIIHHARKISMVVNAAAEYPGLDEAGKAGELLIRLSATKESTLNNKKVRAVASAANLNVRTELPHYLSLLRDLRLIDGSGDEIQVLGLSTRNVLRHASSIFDDGNPHKRELAAIAIGELSSHSPVALSQARDYIGDTFEMSSSDTKDFIRRSGEIGFVDIEGDDFQNMLLFNGNLFRRDSVQKTTRVLSSLSSKEQTKLKEILQELDTHGCLQAELCETKLGLSLFEKIKAAGLLEINTVSNEEGEHSFVTSPGAFHKYVSPLIDNSFDMAKALVSALSYGIHLRRASEGRIVNVKWILGALIRGDTIGPATAIGADYRILEHNRVVELIPANRNMYHMKLLKKEIGELALNVLSYGDANAETISSPPGAPMAAYIGPERTREQIRKKQSTPSRQHTHDILSALRGRRNI